METIDINEVFAQANVVENLKNFAGIDAQNALSMMTPERLAAVVGGMVTLLPEYTDLNTINTSGRYFVANCVNRPPIGGWIFIDVMVRPGVPSQFIQIANSIATARRSSRVYNDNQWSEWV